VTDMWHFVTIMYSIILTPNSKSKNKKLIENKINRVYYLQL